MEKKKRIKGKKKVKNNKGFTLIEIIGVVIILGIVTGIGAMAVQGYIHETKVKTYESYKQGLKGASEDLLIDCMNNNEEECEVPQKGRDLRLGYQELVEKGYSKRLKDPEGEGYCDKSYVIASNESEEGVELKYKVCLYCSKYKSTENGCKELDSSDKTRPTCGTSKGESKEWSKENKVISVKCNDTGGSGCRYPEFSKSIGKEGKEIKSTTITIEDNAGNKSSCPVNAYVDRKAPTCRLKVDESPNSNGWYKNGPTVRLEEIEDEESGIKTYGEDKGSGVEIYGMGTSLVNREYNKKTSYRVTGGIVTVFGYVRDKVGNEGYCSKELYVDNTNPTGVIQMGYEVYPKEDTKSTNLNMTVSNIGRYGNIKGVAVTLNKDPKGTRIIASIGSKSQAVSANSKGVMIEFNEETTGSELKIESTSTLLSSIEKIEVIKEENETSIWTNKDVSVYVKGKDTVTGVGEYSFNNGLTYGIERVKTYGSNTSGTVKIKDKAGNESVGYPFKITKIDKVAPTLTVDTYVCGDSECKSRVANRNQQIITENNNRDKTANEINWTNKGGYFSYSVTDNESGFSYKTWQWNQAGNNNYNYSYPSENNSRDTLRTGNQTLSAAGYRVGKITVYDQAGNSSSVTVKVKIDRTAPTLTVDTYVCGDSECKSRVANRNQQIITENNNRNKTANEINWTNKGGYFSYSVTDNESGFSYKTWQWNQDGNNNYNYSYPSENNSRDTLRTGNQTLSAAGYRVGKITVYDQAGNSSSVTVKVKIDRQKPSCELIATGTMGNNNWYRSDVRISFRGNPTDQGGSGIKSYGIGSVTGNKTAILTEDTSGRKYTGHVIDNAGNDNSCTITVAKDSTKPTLTLNSLIIEEYFDRDLKQFSKSLSPKSGKLFCLTEAERFLNFLPSYLPEDNLSGVGNPWWEWEIYDHQGKKTDSCLQTAYENPCTLRINATVIDEAGNQNTRTDDFILDYYHQYPGMIEENNKSCAS